MKKGLFVLLTFAFVLIAFQAFAEDWEKYSEPVATKVRVRVLSRGAKAMSQHTGALVVIRNARTGEELDKGVVQGSTGDDTALMNTGYPRASGKLGLLKGEKGALFENVTSMGKMAAYESKTDAALFETEIKISKPTQLLVEAYGPLMPQHSMSSTMTSFWLFPGEDIQGEGIVLELRGLILDVLDSMRNKEIKAADYKDGVTVPFYLRMMCGCPIAPDNKTLWPAEGFNITTQAYFKGKLYHEAVTSSDKIFKDVSYFETIVPMPKDVAATGDRERIKVRITVSQPDQNNTGMDEFDLFLMK